MILFSEIPVLGNLNCYDVSTMKSIVAAAAVERCW